MVSLIPQNGSGTGAGLRALSYTSAHLVPQVQLGAGPAAVEGFLPEPLGPDLQSSSTGGAAGRPGRPITELAVQGAGDVADLLHIAWQKGLKMHRQGEEGSWRGRREPQRSRTPSQ